MGKYCVEHRKAVFSVIFFKYIAGSGKKDYISFRHLEVERESLGLSNIDDALLTFMKTHFLVARMRCRL